MSIGFRVIGWDSSVWDLRYGPVRLLPGGLKGLVNLIPIEDNNRAGAALDGQTHVDWRADTRTGLLPVLIGGKPSTEAAFLKLDSQWWNVWQPEKVNLLEATSSTGTVRTLGLRIQEDGVEPDHDPTIAKAYPAPMKVVADNPWWAGEDVGGTYANGAGFQFFGGGGTVKKGPPFRISSANTVARPVIANRGNDDVWPTYAIRGPVTKFVSRIDGKVTQSSINVVAGKTLTIYTDPVQQVAYLANNDGSGQTNVTRNLDTWGFGRIPPGASVTLDLALNGTGAVKISAPTRYFKAWG